MNITIFTSRLQNPKINNINKESATIVHLQMPQRSKSDTICSENNVYAVTLNMKGGGCAGFEYEWGTYATPRRITR